MKRVDKKRLDDLDNKINEEKARRIRHVSKKSDETAKKNMILDRETFMRWFNKYKQEHKENPHIILDEELLWNKYKTTILDNPWIIWKPLITADFRSPQAEFLLCDCMEVFYGGAGGGGKTVALLAGALQYVDYPGYSALLLRRTISDLNLPGSSLNLALKWLHGKKVRFDSKNNRFVFPSGAELVFGYCENIGVVQRYRSAQFQYIGVDELTQWDENQYLFLFSRLRRRKGVKIPLRMRCASNPGDRGHEWVKRRFIDQVKEDRVFIPAKICDNPMLDQEGYRKSLKNLDPVTRKRIEDGDWKVTTEGMFKKKWFSIVDDYPKGGRKLRFWDLASTPKNIGSDPDYTAGALLTRVEGVTYIIDVFRFRESPHGIEKRIQACALNDGREVAIWMEEEGGASGKIVTDHYARNVLPGYIFRGTKSTGSKINRATPFACAAERGNVRLVKGPWNEAFLNEVVLFPYGAHDDQVDAVSRAFNKLIEHRPLGGDMVDSIFGNRSIRGYRNRGSIW